MGKESLKQDGKKTSKKVEEMKTKTVEEPTKTNQKSWTGGGGEWWMFFGLLMIGNILTRFYKVLMPPWVCWDETHFGKFGSWYINRTFFFDVHPPLGKMFIGAAGYLTGYNGTFPFDKPGDLYMDHNYEGMRLACTALGAFLCPFSFLTVWELTRSTTASLFAGALVLFDVGQATLNRYILLDPILLFFISGGTYCMVKFRSHGSSPFSFAWWSWLTMTGLMIGGAISVKFVGLFVILLVGLNTVEDLWNILGDVSKPILNTVKHFLARAVCLIALPIALYVFLFWIHLTVLYKTGPGDGHFSSNFQSSLEGNALHNASMPRYLSYGAVITLKGQRNGGGYLHSHYHIYPEGVGAKQQQVTTYAHKDDNNKFLVKRFFEAPAKNETLSNNGTDINEKEDHQDDEEAEYVRSGDLIRLEHVITKRNIHTHQQPAPLSKKNYQVTGYGENGVGDSNDVWMVHVVDGYKGDLISAVTTKIKIQHFHMKCFLTSTGKELPKWAFSQGEVTCDPSKRNEPKNMWNVEQNYQPKLPNVSVSNFSPGFFSRFIECHAVMLTGNAGLKPKEGEYTSRPWEWIINLKGQHFSGLDHRVYLLGNPIIWWGNFAFLGLFLLTVTWNAVRYQRGYDEVTTADEAIEVKNNRIYGCVWLFIGWALHYVPFWSMGRVLYFHHYFPAMLFSSMITAILMDYILDTLKAALPENTRWMFRHSFIGGVLAILGYSFYLFSPLVYGMDDTPGHMENSSVHHLKWLATWEF